MSESGSIDEKTEPTRIHRDQPKESRWGAWWARLSRGWMGGALAGAAAVSLDTMWVWSSATEDHESGWLSLFLADWGVVAPALVVTSLAFSLLSILTHPSQPLAFGEAVRWLGSDGTREQVNRAVLLPMGMVGLWAWVVGTAHISRYLLNTLTDARAAGLAMGAVGIMGAMLVVVVAYAVFTGIRAALSSRRREVRARFKAWWTGALAFVLVVAMAVWGIKAGTVGGEGGVLGFMGVFRRLELDLRAPLLLLAVGLGAFLAPSVLRRVWAPLAFAVGLAPLGWTVHAATALDDPQLAVQLERYSPLSQPSLRVLRRLTDRDGDGAAAYFGGGDCDDRNPEIHPLAVDIPGDGIDQDCSGSDAPIPEVVKPMPSDTKVEEQAARLLPKDLNVLLISVDTLRWDMGFMGYGRNITPAIDALAKKAVVFEKTYAMSSYTGKAIGPMMSGKYPSETHMGWKHYNTYPETDIMVQERLRDAGIWTMAIHCHWYFKKETGLGRGMDVFDLSALPTQGIDATTDTSYSADRLSDAAIKVLSDSANTSKPFYAWVHYFDPHAEYLIHKGTEEFGRKPRDLYDHEVRWTDDQIKRLLDFVAEQPWGEKTAIVVTSDHGEAFGEHGMFRHGFEVWEEIVRVPLIIYVPGVSAKRVTQRRSLVDLVPTILDLMGVKRGEAKHDTDFVSGVSLVPDLLSEPGKEPAQREILVDMPPGPFNEARRAYIRGDMKLIVAGGIRYQLFDLGADPQEKKDLSKDKELLTEQRRHYDQFRAQLREIPLRPPKN
ncbi:MAG TPA: sulfatase-like hydrolase/transferase [Polyangiaceae bacterium]|nr:MAG: Choline-sulfatase [Deltaproteobacteria bacterium ADurb.Bin207]HNS97628.1 sulfatase-like hydrolase/transferase [Polyangiaceae bacterium]HNZ24112.1 sulfatase-like hydrolase/transferase [Polyangiaceae bacterium]HOD23582.1 sulfatase-like hydrolase/transferase [Polyangiaceae bacterium]HOE48796.1 sulfatase-like hydrolase/transferase [Polyangiaceae bacterium]